VFWRRKGGDIMAKKRDLIIVALATFCLTSALFMIMPTRSTPAVEYDPWLDYNDDGIVDISDILETALHFGATGTPINKTALLYNVNDTFTKLLSKIDALNTSLLNHEAYFKTTIAILNATIAEQQSRIANLETRMPKKGYIFISPAAFTPESSSSTYGKNYIQLHGQGAFYAHLQVPDGVTIKNMTAYLLDLVTDGNVFVKLYGINRTTGHYLGDIGLGMALVGTTYEENPGDIVLYDDTIADATIDNRNCIYTLIAGFAYDTAFLQMKGVRIEYEYQS
jgi:hypothetical protein